MNRIISQIKSFIKETDKILLLLSIIISTFGILLVASATGSGNGEFSRDARVMIIAVAAGIIMALIISAIDYNFIIKLWPVIAGVCLLLMLLLFIPGVGVGPPSRPDVKTWIAFGSSGLYFQPSELVKIGFIITFSVHLDSLRDNLNELKSIILLCAHGATPVLLVLVSGDMGSALIFIMIFIVMMYAAGLKMRYFAIGGGLVIAAVPLAWNFVFSSIQKDRILALFNPEEYPDIIYQQEQGLRAIRNGGVFGKGLFQGEITRAGIVPESENDMIYSVIGEEFGLIGCLLTLVIFTLLVIRIVRIGRNCHDATVSLICAGSAAMIASQVIVNIGMCLELLPVIGITLPFLSAGGSSNLCIYIAIGLLLSLARHTSEKEVVNFRFKNISTPFD
ncbi:MAG: FtsW/RodA/SpoVE family cell cycle protein [Clostridia bacterium]|nr:FtsW/RodA/SpoVE family cell cycle protein [Clostridia bacterium]